MSAATESNINFAGNPLAAKARRSVIPPQVRGLGPEEHYHSAHSRVVLHQIPTACHHLEGLAIA